MHKDSVFEEEENDSSELTDSAVERSKLYQHW